jgi:hypothetical protein
MERNVVVRRCAHMSIALSPVYYLAPEELPVVEVPREALLLLFLSSVVLFEHFRLRRRISVVGLRPHECDSVASFVWAAAGITVALWLFPMWIAVAAVVGMALVDPLAGELRAAHASVSVSLLVPFVAYFAICAGLFLFSREFGAAAALVMSAVGAAVAVAAEAADVRFVDDDLLMIVVPGAVLAGLSLLL